MDFCLKRKIVICASALSHLALWVVVCMDGFIDVWMDEWKVGRMYGCMHGWMEEWMDL